MAVLGLAACHCWENGNCRYVTKASLRHITMERQCLRWWMTARPCIHPLLPFKRIVPNGKGPVQVLHLLRWFTHTPRHSGASNVDFFGKSSRSRNSGECTGVQNAYSCSNVQKWTLQVIFLTFRKMKRGVGINFFHQTVDHDGHVHA